jgi:flagellar basal body-associated protein FliL
MGVIMGVSLMMIMVMVNIAVVMLVAVVPEFCLIEQEEKQQTEQQGHKQVVGFYTCFEGLRQEVQKSCGQQCTCSQAQHVLGIATHNAKAKPGCQPNTSNTSGQGAYQNSQ